MKPTPRDDSLPGRSLGPLAIAAAITDVQICARSFANSHFVNLPSDMWLQSLVSSAFVATPRVVRPLELGRGAAVAARLHDDLAIAPPGANVLQRLGQLHLHGVANVAWLSITLSLVKRLATHNMRTARVRTRG